MRHPCPVRVKTDVGSRQSLVRSSPQQRTCGRCCVMSVWTSTKRHASRPKNSLNHASAPSPEFKMGVRSKESTHNTRQFCRRAT
jgi:hypothetical protein